MYTIVAWPASAQKVGCLGIILPLHGFNYHQLASVIGLRHTVFSLTLHTMAMLVVRT